MGPTLPGCAQVSHCDGFSCCGAQALGHAGFHRYGSQALECRLSSCGGSVVVHGFSCPAACGILPDQGANPCILQWILKHWTTREVPELLCLFLKAVSCPGFPTSRNHTIFHLVTEAKTKRSSFLHSCSSSASRLPQPFIKKYTECIVCARHSFRPLGYH